MIKDVSKFEPMLFKFSISSLMSLNICLCSLPVYSDNIVDVVIGFPFLLKTKSSTLPLKLTNSTDFSIVFTCFLSFTRVVICSSHHNSNSTLINLAKLINKQIIYKIRRNKNE